MLRSVRPRARSLLVALALAAAALTPSAARAQATCIEVTFAQTSRWPGGYVGEFRIRNCGTTTVNGWEVRFSLPAGTGISTVWNAALSASGNNYTARNVSYNATIPPGGMVSFGIVASGDGLPSNCTVNSAPCQGGGGGGGGDTTPPSAPGNLRVTSAGSTSVSLAWNPSSDNVGVTGYDVRSGDVLMTSVTGTTATVTGLAANTTYSFYVVARDAAGNVSPPSNTVQVTTSGGGQIGEVRTVVENLAVPWGIAFLPDGSALVAERDTARVVRVTPNGQVTTVGTVPGVVPGGEGGLLGLATSPNFASDNLVYAYFTAASDNRIVRMTFTGGQLGAPQPVLTGIPKASIHNGGRIVFGPDGMLYAGTGDAAQGSNAQNVNSLGGKVLRMTPTGQPAPGNPFPGSVVYSLGHRNVQGLAFDASGRLWVSEFGQNLADELNLIRAGGNYGWPTCEGACNRSEFIDPVRQWAPAEASPSGIAIANNVIYMASLRGARLWRMPIAGDGVQTPQAFFVGTYGRLRTVERSPDGGLWLATNNRDGRGTPRQGDDRILHVQLN